MYSEENRALNYAIAASIVLHGALLFGIAQRDRPRPAEPPIPSILARLVESPTAVPAAEAPSLQVPAKPSPRAKSAAPKRLAQPAPTPQPLAESAVEQAPVAEAQVESASPQPPALPAEARAAQAPSSNAIAGAQAAGAPPAEDPGSLEQYRLQLIDVARKYRHYPLSARRNDWRGVVALRVVVAPGGGVASLTVTRTSGHEVLDRQAQEMFRSAAADVPVPPVLRGKQFAVDVAVDYYFTD